MAVLAASRQRRNSGAAPHSPAERRALVRRRKTQEEFLLGIGDSEEMGRLFPQRKPVVLHTFPMCCILFVTKKFLFTCRDQFGGKKSIRIKNRLNGARVGLLRGKGTYHSIKSFQSNPVQLHECMNVANLIFMALICHLISSHPLDLDVLFLPGWDSSGAAGRRRRGKRGKRGKASGRTPDGRRTRGRPGPPGGTGGKRSIFHTGR